MLEFIILCPIVAAILAFIFRGNSKVAEILACAGAIGATFVFIISLYFFFNAGGVKPLSEFSDLLRMDALSALLISITSVVSLLIFIYAIGYMRHEVNAGVIEDSQLGIFYAQMSIFLSAMLTALLASNLIHIWAAIELTTLSSVFLISFYNNTYSLEAAWKYFIINSVGITLALVGILILFYAFSQAGIEGSSFWSVFASDIAKVNPLYLKLAFTFVLVGFGTKTGLVPFHVWLPDAHSQAPTPVSGLLSGVLLNIAFYGILRVYSLISLSPSVAIFASNLLIFFGMLSIAIAALRLFAQSNLKRLLAYSSVENMGIIALSVGIGGPIGLFAAFFHMLSHSLAKPLAFLLGGIITTVYNTKEMPSIKGAGSAIPIFGLLFLLAVLGVAGSVPFGTFFSELAFLAAALSKGQFLVAFLFILFTTVVFGSFLYRISEMVFGQKPKEIEYHGVGSFMSFSVIMLMVLAVYLALSPPDFIIMLIKGASNVVGGS